MKEKWLERYADLKLNKNQEDLPGYLTDNIGEWVSHMSTGELFSEGFVYADTLSVLVDPKNGSVTASLLIISPKGDDFSQNITLRFDRLIPELCGFNNEIILPHMCHLENNILQD